MGKSDQLTITEGATSTIEPIVYVGSIEPRYERFGESLDLDSIIYSTNTHFNIDITR